MRDVFELGTTVPNDEPCAQVGDINSITLGRMEATALINQLRRIHGNEPQGARFKVVQCPHDFGTYNDVALEYDDTHDEEGGQSESEKYLYRIEGGIPDHWDEEAKKELEDKNYFQLLSESKGAKELI